jgi:predicted membrane chloride channel (bestrophin family)
MSSLGTAVRKPGKALLGVALPVICFLLAIPGTTFIMFLSTWAGYPVSSILAALVLFAGGLCATYVLWVYGPPNTALRVVGAAVLFGIILGILLGLKINAGIMSEFAEF